jgi:hypothetical protein
MALSPIGLRGMVSLPIVMSRNNVGTGVQARVLKRKHQQPRPISIATAMMRQLVKRGRRHLSFSVRQSPIGVSERSGQLRPYVRPVSRRLPLAIMGVRLRVRHQSGWRAQGTCF